MEEKKNHYPFFHMRYHIGVPTTNSRNHNEINCIHIQTSLSSFSLSLTFSHIHTRLMKKMRPWNSLPINTKDIGTDRTRVRVYQKKNFWDNFKNWGWPPVFKRQCHGMFGALPAEGPTTWAMAHQSECLRAGRSQLPTMPGTEHKEGHGWRQLKTTISRRPHFYCYLHFYFPFILYVPEEPP